MRKTTLALAAATLLGGLALGTGSASAACGLQAGAAPTTYVAMMGKKKMMMRNKMMKKKMMRRKMMKKKMM